MKKSITAIAFMLCISNSLSAQSGAEAGASAVFERFLVAMTNADADTVVSLFTEDALFWGTGSQALVTDTAGIINYFAAVGRNEPGQTIARARNYETAMLSDNLVLVSGVWEILPSGRTEGIPLRVSMALALREGEWKIIQFHNSAVPE